MSATTPTGAAPAPIAADDARFAASHSGVKFRPDIEGLRALAIIVVVLDHLGVPGFRGGFVGVDVFFVISGFLITSLLAAEQRRNVEAARIKAPDSISIRSFYGRRARRILPAGLTVIAFTLIAGKLLMNSVRFQSVKADALWATFFGENIHLMRQATDYFAQGTAVSPLQNYWSLAVEEQFYLVWPLLFIAAAWIYKDAHITLASKFRMVTLKRVPNQIGNWQARVLTAVAALFALSLVWSIHATSANPAPAYYSPFTRAYELALGALVALAAPMLRLDERLSGRTAGGAGILGFGLIIASIAVITPSTPFPGAWGLLPTCGAALLIVAGLNRSVTTPTGTLLSTAAARFIGRISYSLYLWHWPLIVFAGLIVSKQRIGAPAWDAALAAISVLVAWGSYHLIEQPFRKLDAEQIRLAFMSISKRRPTLGAYGQRSRQRPVAPTVSARKLAAMAAGALLVFGTIAALARPEPKVDTKANAVIQAWADGSALATPAGDDGTLSGTEPGASGFSPSTKADRQAAYNRWLASVSSAATRTKATPAEAKQAQKGEALGPDHACYDIMTEARAKECSAQGLGRGKIFWPKGTPKRIVLMGHSISAQFLDSVIRAAPKDVTVTPLVLAGCELSVPFNAHQRLGNGLDCGAHNEFAFATARKMRPGMVIFATHLGSVADARNPDMQAMGRRIRAISRHNLIIVNAPPTKSFAECMNGLDIAACRQPASANGTLQAIAAGRAMAGAFGMKELSLTKLICSGGLCPPFIDGTTSRFDGDHLTVDMMKRLDPFVAERISSTVNSPS